MTVTLTRQESRPNTLGAFNRDEPSAITELNKTDEAEVLEFLSQRPIHTVVMISLIRDNGLLSPSNRGSFYACRNQDGVLEGVALLGHAILVEARTANALSSFARLARNCLNANLIRGEQETLAGFWKYYANGGPPPRLTCREMLLELRQLELTQPFAPERRTIELRPATLKDLERVLAVNAAMALQEAGINPMQNDPGGFRARAERRIEQGRIWVLTHDDRLVFKADVIAEAPQATYLEGVHVHPEERRKGYGLDCLASLTTMLLQRTESICLTVNAKNQNSLKFYEKAGYQFHSHYETIYLR
jgi:ribosomal protein S18 acetylase RimI-like enzyme